MTLPRRSPPRGTPARNRLLAALSPQDLQRLRPDLQVVTLEPKQSIYRSGERITSVYFPTAGMYSLATGLADGTLVDSASIGNEGVLGAEALLRSRPSATGQCVLRIPPGEAFRISTTSLRRALSESPALRDLLGSYVETLFEQTMRSLACQARHTAYERCCRWLLMINDRVGSTFSLSHELLATMVGNRRQTITTIAANLQQAGSIQYKHGQITVLDRSSLEAGACECYETERRQLERMFQSVSYRAM